MPLGRVATIPVRLTKSRKRAAYNGDVKMGQALSSDRKHRPRRERVICAVLLALLALVVGSGTTPVSAHARLVASDPVAGSALVSFPDEFVLTFNEALDPGLSSFRLTNAAGDAIALGEPSIDPDDSAVVRLQYLGESPEPGVYTLIWRVLSAVDGHVTSGTVPFSVGTGESPAVASTEAARPPWWQIVPRWLELAGWALLAGIAAFGLLNLPVVLAAGATTRRVLVDRFRMAWFFAFTLAFAGMVSGIVAQTQKVTGATSLSSLEASALGDVLAETDYGRGWMIRLALAIALLLIVGLLPRLRQRWNWLLLLALAVAGIVTISATGHAAGEDRKWLAVAVDTIHMTCAGIWIGGLVAVVLSALSHAGSETTEDATIKGQLVRNHSRTSLVVMAVIISTGVLSASFHVGGFRSLQSEDYGITLMTKVALLIIVLVAAAINLLVLVPRLNAFSKAGAVAQTWRELRSIGYVAAFEVALASLILLATAVLTVLSPADYPLQVDVAGRALLVDETVTAEDLTIRMLATVRGNPGDAYTIAVADADGHIPAEIQRVIVETSLLEGADAGLGDRFDAEPVAGEPGSYSFAASRLGLEGQWSLNVIVRRAGVEDVETAFIVDTAGSAPGQPRLVEDTWRLPKMTLAAWGFLALAVIMVIIGLAGLRRLTGMEPVASGVLLAMCILIATGFAISATRQTIPLTAGHDLANPVEPGDVSLRSGEALFAANCMLCHGVDGQGVSTAGMSHTEDEADLLSRDAREQSDGDLFTWISEGVPSTDMPAFDEALTEQERWDLVNYIRALQNAEDE